MRRVGVVLGEVVGDGRVEDGRHDQENVCRQISRRLRPSTHP
jgi:hypothetical protein